MAGGRRPNPDAGALSDDDPDNDTVEDNTWAVGDEFLVEGDPTTVRGILFDGLYDLANGIENSTEATWNGALPLLGLRPRDLTPQLAQLRTVAADLGAASNCRASTTRRPTRTSARARGWPRPTSPSSRRLLQKKVERLAGDAADEALVRSRSATGGGAGRCAAPGAQAFGAREGDGGRAVDLPAPRPTGTGCAATPFPRAGSEEPSGEARLPVRGPPPSTSTSRCRWRPASRPRRREGAAQHRRLRLALSSTSGRWTSPEASGRSTSTSARPPPQGTHQEVTGTNTAVALERRRVDLRRDRTGRRRRPGGRDRDFAALDAAGALAGAAAPQGRADRGEHQLHLTCVAGTPDAADSSTLPCAAAGGRRGRQRLRGPHALGRRRHVHRSTTAGPTVLVDTDVAAGGSAASSSRGSSPAWWS